jgi:hypothetical protein
MMGELTAFWSQIDSFKSLCDFGPLILSVQQFPHLEDGD